MTQGNDPRTEAFRRLCEQTRQPFLSQPRKTPWFQDHRDRGLFQELVRGVIRNRTLLDWHIQNHSQRPIEKIDPQALNALRLGLYQILFLHTPAHAAVSESVELMATCGREKAKSFVNATLRAFLRGPQANPPKENWQVYYSFPPLLLEHFQEAFSWAGENGQQFEKLLETLNAPPALCLRVNILKTDRETLIKKWQQFDPQIIVEKTQRSPVGLIIRGQKDLTHLPGYKNGEFMVQSESSQLVPYLFGPWDSGLTVLDACAAPGGKCIHMAELQGDEGKITALSPPRNPEAGESSNHFVKNLKRLQIRSVEIVEKTAEEFAQQCPPETFDRILIDAPCTGLGTLGKLPERKWIFQKKHVKKLCNQQKSIFESVFPLLKKNGILVFSLCSISLPEWQVGFTMGTPLKPAEDDQTDWRGIYNEKNQAFIFWPYHLNSEGLFALRLGKINE